MKAIALRLRHRLAHKLGLNLGEIETWTSRSGRLMIGFRCECGELLSIHESHALPSDKWFVKVELKKK